MSLDVTLTQRGHRREAASRIFIREGGSAREISREEWQIRWPDREPFVMKCEADSVVYEGNITHNLGRMARAAGMYAELWRPEEIGITKAAQLIEPLRLGLAQLKAEPETYQRHSPENGWGTYEGLVAFVEAYLAACKAWPDADVSVDPVTNERREPEVTGFRAGEPVPRRFNEARRWPLPGTECGSIAAESGE